MNYSKIQKIISSLLIFFFLSSFTFRIPFYTLLGAIVFASDSKHYDVVSIIVEENVYDKLKSKIDRYATDIQAELPMTKAIIIPTPKETNPYNIASLNEKLFFEGYKGLPGLSGNSKLVGTVLVGDLPLPVVFDKNNASKTILPYVDFEDKQYIYNNENFKYEKNQNSGNLKAEIWHGFITPGVADSENYIKKLSDFFDKDHDFYQKKGNFNDSILTKVKPSVFYFDAIRETQSIKYVEYQAYNNYLDNIEDLTYHRYSKELANKLTKSYVNNQNSGLKDSMSFLGSDLKLDSIPGSPKLEGVPDIQTLMLTNKAVKKFINIFNASSISDMRKNIHNAGRYNEANSVVNQDFIPGIITTLDATSKSVLKNINNDLEGFIDNIVKKGLSRKMAVPMTATSGGSCHNTYTNILFGRQGKDVNSAKDCTIYRGATSNSGKLTEANRAFNLKKNSILDVNKLKRENAASCLNPSPQTSGWFAGNSPVNMDAKEIKKGNIVLGANANLKKSITPLFDVGGAKEVKDITKTPSPLNCYDNNFITTTIRRLNRDDDCITRYNVPINGTPARAWSCRSENILFNYDKNFDTLYKGGACSGFNCSNSGLNISFKPIPSYLEHKSPNSSELTDQVNAMISPDLPIDKDRYIDFIGIDGALKAIKYPYLFRVLVGEGEKLTLETIDVKLKDYFDEKSKEINSLISSTSPDLLSGRQKELYNILSTGTYPKSDIDLYKYLKEKPIKTLIVSGEKKELSYYDTLVFSIYWNNLKSVPAKYKFVFENYLSDEFGNDYKVPLPNNKKLYDIAYIGAEGNSREMYVKIDPEEKGENPYSKEIKKNIEDSTKLLGAKIGASGAGKSPFECAPPEGVPIWQWMPAVMCWVKNMLPPKIKVTKGSCSFTPNGEDSGEDDIALSKCSGDKNKNSIDDCIEKLNGGKINLISNSKKYYFNNIGSLKAIINDKSGNTLPYISNIDVNFKLTKVEIPTNLDEPISSTNLKTVYDISSPNLSTQNNLKEAQKIISFKDLKVRLQGGTAKYSFVTKNKEANIYIKAYSEIKNQKGKVEVFSTSEPLLIKIRGDRLFSTNHLMYEFNGGIETDIGSYGLKASDKTNITIIDAKKTNLKDIEKLIYSTSSAPEKAVFSIFNYSKNGKKLPLAYPLTLKIYRDGNITKTQKIDKINTFFNIGAYSKTGEYKFEFIDNNGVSTTQELEITPDKPTSIDFALSTSTVETGGTKSVHLFTIYDKYKNIVLGEPYKIEAEISGNGLLFENNKKQQTFNVFEGYKPFIVKSTDIPDTNTIKFSLVDKLNQIDVKTQKNIFTKKDLQLDVSFSDLKSIKVGNKEIEYTLVIKDKLGNPLTGFNSRSYLNIPNIYGESKTPYIEIKNGIGKGIFTTKTLASKNVSFEFKVEGIKQPIVKNLPIYPEIPAYIDLLLDNSKLEAEYGKNTDLNVELKDKYGNIVFNRPKTVLSLEILDKYKHIITTDKKVNIALGGKGNFNLKSTDMPGIAYFKVSTTSDLDLEKVGRLDTYYFWNDKKLADKKYNALYTMLLGSNYGDITKENYLAGSLIFNPKNRALVVTSTLNNPYNYNDVISVSPAGKLKILSTGDITQNIVANINTQTPKTSIDLYNKTLKTLIGTLYYNFDPTTTELVNCETALSTCKVSDKNSTILFKKITQNNSVVINGDKLSLLDSQGESIIEINKSGKILKQPGVTLELEKKLANNYAGFIVRKYGEDIGYMAFNILGDNSIKTTRKTSELTTLLTKKENKILIFVNDSNYGARANYLSNSTHLNLGLNIWYSDPFEGSKSLNSFNNGYNNGIESFSKKGGIGWKEDNKSLLLFSAGENAGNATKKYQSFSMINIGDPVISLAKKPKNLPNTNVKRSFDSTLGALISNEDGISDYSVFDYNKDELDDIVILKDNGLIKLLSNKEGGRFVDSGNLAYLVDLGTKSTILTGDFFGDGYDDIFLVNKKGEPVILNNIKKDFKRYDLKEDFALDGMISQAKTFDMNNDGFDDIITIDDSGDINIFYGKQSSADPVFSKNTVSSGNGVKLDSKERTDMGAVYFDGLYQLPGNEQAEEAFNSEKLSKKAKDTINKFVKESTSSGSSSINPASFKDGEFNEGFVNKMIFYQFNYDPNFKSNTKPTQQDKKDFIIGRLPKSIVTEQMKKGLEKQSKDGSDIADIFAGDKKQTADGKKEVFNVDGLKIGGGVNSIGSGIDETTKVITSFLNKDAEDLNPGGNSYNVPVNSDKITTFIRSEYGKTQGVDIKKIFTDKNKGFLKGLDIVDVSVTIKNTTNKTIKNIAYLEQIPKMFKQSKSSGISMTIAGKTDYIAKKAPGGLFSFMFDGFDLNPGETAKIQYQLKTIPFKYGYIQVGLFEKNEAGDDKFGDIVLKEKKENCGKKSVIFRSISEDKYEKGTKTPSCDADKSKLPEVVQKNSIDKDGNGVPDYIDDLVSSAKTENKTDFQEYAKKSINDLNKDSDNDGLPDTYDDSPEFSDEEDFMNSLDQFNGSIENITEGVDTILQGFNCGFGGGGCITNPLNAAPLAPGSSLTLFGYPVAPAVPSQLYVAQSGIPVFSAVTLLPPFAWPPMPIGAGGIFGYAPGPFRLFVTPTLTGAVGVAMCFGDNVAAPYGLFPGLSPLAPGGNCVVAAKPLIGCSSDGSDGDIEGTGYPQVQNSDYSVFIGNCHDSSGNKGKTPYIGEKSATSYLEYKKTGKKTESLKKDLTDVFSKIAKPGEQWELPNGPLISIGGESSDGMEVSVDLNFDGLNNGSLDFDDVLEINLKRVFPFPDFIMEWVTRQVEEIVTKLTDFPTIFVILPDFSGIFDDRWGNFFDNIESSFNEGYDKKPTEEELAKESNDAKKEAVKEAKMEKETHEFADAVEQTTNDVVGKENIDNIKKEGKEAIKEGKKVVSGIKSTYEFLSNLPMVSIEEEKINVSIPWIDKTTINKTILDWKTKKKQWLNEIDEKKKIWSLGQLGCDDDFTKANNYCNSSGIKNPTECKQKAQEKLNECRENYKLQANISIGVESLVSSLEENIEILEEYKRFPEKLNKYIRQKEVRLGQILCNLETISKILGGRIGKNGERFKSWVELIVLIKAILKSWQLIIDIFLDFEAECHECKNERRDLMYAILKLISLIIPKIPVIKFPKWPDIILDLHNIRANLAIRLPEFDFNLRPILLPSLPELKLPDVPSISLSLNLPEVPILPRLELPELPDIPSLPTIELPNLPPPPTLPRILSSISFVLNILKLITKMMCFLKSSFLVPEWRAGDQISFITERAGYLPIDFLDLSLPQFSFPFIDAIKVTTFVNLEFDVDFLVEMSRQSMQPLDTFTNNIANMLDISLPDLDFSEYTPSDINIDVDKNGTDVNFGLNLNSTQKSKLALYKTGIVFAAGISKLVGYIDQNKNETVSNSEFKKLVREGLSTSKIVSDSRLEALRKIWTNVDNVDYSKEDKIISDLAKNNVDKFEELKSIIDTEMEHLQKLKKNINNIDYSKKDTSLISLYKDDKISVYNDRLTKYNLNTIKSIKSLGKTDKTSELKKEGKAITSRIKNGMTSFEKSLKPSHNHFANSKIAYEANKFTKKNSPKLLTAVTNTNNSPQATPTSTALNSSPIPTGTKATCGTGKANTYKYEGVYVVELNKNYRLFDYLDELQGDEQTKSIDFDKDGDEDLLYKMDGKIYLKESTKNIKKKIYITEPAYVLSKNKNIFYNGYSFKPAINNLKESGLNSNSIAISFSQPTNNKINNFKTEFYPTTDSFELKKDEEEVSKKYIIDSVVGIENATKDKETSAYAIHKNLAKISYSGNVTGARLITKELISVKDKIKDNILLNINTGTKIYTGKTQAKIFYKLESQKDEDKISSIILGNSRNIEFADNILITGLEGDVYLKGTKSVIYEGMKITSSFVGKPLLSGSEIQIYDMKNYTSSSHIDITYYDNSKTVLELEKVKYFKLYDLGAKSDVYTLFTDIPNDFYYAKTSAFKNNIFGTNSKKILISPQVEADTNAPSLDINDIKIPVYQTKTINITNDIFEDGGISNIKELYIDYDLDRDTSLDGDKLNDNDLESVSKIKIQKTNTSINLVVGPYNSIFSKKIRVYSIDKNDNIGFDEINLTSYSPDLAITSDEGGKVQGKLLEPISSQPTSLYRIRSGGLQKVNNNNTNNSGNFEFASNGGDKGLVLQKTINGKKYKIAEVDENTGKIKLIHKDASIYLQQPATSSNTSTYPKIEIRFKGETVYSEYLKYNSGEQIYYSDDFSSIPKDDSGVFVQLKPLSKHIYKTLPTGISYNPGSIILYLKQLDKETPVMSIFKDGGINILSKDYRLSYNTYEGNIVYDIVKISSKKTIGSIYIKTNFNYVVD